MDEKYPEHHGTQIKSYKSCKHLPDDGVIYDTFNNVMDTKVITT